MPRERVRSFSSTWPRISCVLGSAQQMANIPDNELGATAHWTQPLGAGLLLLAGSDVHDVRVWDEEMVASTGSITTSGNKEDFVSMGMTSAMKLKQVVRNTRLVLAIELLTATRALDCLRPLKSSAIIEHARAALAAISAPWTADRALSADIEAVSAWLASGKLASGGLNPQ